MTTVAPPRSARARLGSALSSLPARLKQLGGYPGLLAVLTWLLCLPVSFALPGAIDLSPFTIRGSAAPLLVGIVLVGAGAALARRWRSGTLAGLAAGAFAGWVVLAMHTGLHGTPYGFGGLLGDAGRLTAQAERYTHTVHSADGIVASVPAGFPPLFPWLVGRAAAITGTPAWRLLGVSETLAMSAVILVGFLLWRRLLRDGLALAVTVAGFVVFMDPSKPYAALALTMLFPWALDTFARPPRSRLSFVGAGIVGGLQILLYPLYLIFAALGIAALIVLTARAAPQRGRYLRHVAGVALVSFLVSSWYLIPLLSWAVGHGLEPVALRYAPAPSIVSNPFPFLSLQTPLGALTAVGLAGLAWYWRRAWWTLPLALLMLSAYAYRFGSEAIFAASGNTLALQYTTALATASLVLEGVLTLARAVPAILTRMAVAQPAGLGMFALCVLALWVGTNGWYAWMPGAPTVHSPVFQPALTTLYNEASIAHLQPLPDGHYPRFAPVSGRFPGVPLAAIIADVNSVLGRNATPATLSFTEEPFALESWRGYIGVDAGAAAATSQWRSRFHALLALAGVAGPQAFATASAHTPYGPIDVFVLQARGRWWEWSPLHYGGEVRFAPRQFSSGAFAIFRGLPSGVIVAVRR